MMSATILVVALTLGFGSNPDWNLFLQKATKVHSLNAFAAGPCTQYMAMQKDPGDPGGVDTITVTGKVSKDGSTFTTNCGARKAWTVVNSDVMAKHMGRNVTLDGKFDWHKGTVQVEQVKTSGASRPTTTSKSPK